MYYDNLTIPKGYRPLKKGEIFKKGDKRWSGTEKQGKWIDRDCIGQTVSYFRFNNTIRKIAEQRSETDLKKANWQ